MARILQVAQLGHEILRRRAEEIADVYAKDIVQLIDDMIATTIDMDGVGLGAPQVYQSRRLIIVASRPNARYPYAPQMEPTAMINPKITDYSSELVKDWEGCLSIPGVRGMVPRSKSISVEYLDRNGKAVRADYEDFVARIVQHEVDHLDGITFLDRMDSTKDIVMEREFQKILARQKELRPG